MDKELFENYKKLGRGNWGKDLAIWKTMYRGFLKQAKSEEFNLFTEMLLDNFLDIPKARKEGNPVILPMHFACKHVYNMARATSEAIREETGIRTLIFGVNSYDSREVTSEAIKSKISDFLTNVVT